MISSGTFWAAFAVMLTVIAMVSGAIVYIVNLIVSNSNAGQAIQFAAQIATVKSQFSVDVATINGKLDSLNLAAVWAEIKSLRDWRHDLAPRQMLYDAAVQDINQLQREYVTHCQVAEGKIETIRDLERRVECLEKE